MTAWEPRAGDRVVVITVTPGTRNPDASRTTVERVTPTQIVLADSPTRFDRKTLASKGGTTYGPRSRLVPPDDPEAKAVFTERFRRHMIARAEHALRDWRDTPGETSLADDAIGYIERARTRVLETRLELAVGEARRRGTARRDSDGG